MSFTVRSLLPKVQVFRKDLEEDRSLFAIQESVRKVCRMTGYAQTKLAPVTVANTPTIDLSTLMTAFTPGSVYRIMLVRLLDTNLNAYKVLYEYNSTSIDGHESYRNYATGYPSGWAYKGGSILEVFPTPDKVYTLEVTVSYVPDGEIDTIPLPVEAEEAIVAGALANVLMQPGAGQNISLAKDREAIHNRELDFLKANALLGQSGRPRATGRNLATRAIRMWDNRWQ